MQYISTRGGVAPVGFRDAVMMGLARDGGLLLPAHIPDVSPLLDAWRDLEYPALACEVMRQFVDFDEAEMAALVERSYATFRHTEITPAVTVGPVYILELFHGPTLAFKDVALQLLGNLFETILEARDAHLNILAATSGDTGSAAIHGVRGRDRIRIFVMHPRGRVSPTQERQMTTVLDENVFNLAVGGTFDDCQRIMKTLFADLVFKDACALGTVNSINWARLLAQVVYYVYASLRVTTETGAERVRFSVPTGNFGDIFAGYIAARMGLPISRLVLATNENDILARFFNARDYSLTDVSRTLSPSMDIQVASNFERYLYYRVGSDASRLARIMTDFGKTGCLTLSHDEWNTPEPLIAAGRGDTRDTLETIRRYHAQYGYLLDPHTAVGVHVGESHLDETEPMICLATAHPAKFAAAIREATGEDLAHHPVIDGLEALPTRCNNVDADDNAVRQFVEAHVS